MSPLCAIHSSDNILNLQKICETTKYLAVRHCERKIYLLVLHLYQSNVWFTPILIFYLNVEPVNSDSQVILIFHILLPGIEFLPFVNILSTSGTSHVKWGHQTHCILPVFWQFHARDF